MKKNIPQNYLHAYSLTEVLIVLAIIGILIMMVLPNQTSVVAQARSIEAQNMLNHLYGLQKSYNYRFSKYSANFEELGFEPELTIDQGGQGIYKIQITEASINSFKAEAISVKDFDDDGNFNTWQIDDKKMLVEKVKD
ncbi:MAG: type II secretion system protein [bacterium]|nr:type II secretion system protein [bacterium]